MIHIYNPTIWEVKAGRLEIQGLWVMVVHAARLKIPALRRQRQVDLCELEPAWSTRASSRTPRTVTRRTPVSKHKTNKQTNKKKFKVIFN